MDSPSPSVTHLSVLVVRHHMLRGGFEVERVVAIVEALVEALVEAVDIQTSASGLVAHIHCPLACSSPHAAIANLLLTMTLALSASPRTPVGVPVVGKLTDGLL